MPPKIVYPQKDNNTDHPTPNEIYDNANRNSPQDYSEITEPGKITKFLTKSIFVKLYYFNFFGLLFWVLLLIFTLILTVIINSTQTLTENAINAIHGLLWGGQFFWLALELSLMLSGVLIFKNNIKLLQSNRKCVPKVVKFVGALWGLTLLVGIFITGHVLFSNTDFINSVLALGIVSVVFFMFWLYAVNVLINRILKRIDSQRPFNLITTMLTLIFETLIIFFGYIIITITATIVDPPDSG
ncbi:hypothetical protein DYH10_04205 [Candidatus Saccharibacteria bacterium CPR2]|nr:hypothetical protein [Candidatus Saccharibacteria bacterium CPR2]